MFRADHITAERRNRRALSFWRIVALLSLMAGSVSILISNTKTSTKIARYSAHIARVNVSGLITGDQAMINLLGQVEKSTSVMAVIVRIDSPGGTTVGSEALYDALRKVAAKKPVVGVMDSVAASGGYIAALGTDHVVARGNTITGSIGVIFQWPQVHELMGKIGVGVATIKSGPLKAEPNLFEPANEEAIKVLRQSVMDSYGWFVDLVAERRKLDRDVALKLSDGRVYTGRQALKVKLIDAIGGEDAALKWLQKEKKISKNLKIVSWKTPTLAQKAGISLSMMNSVLNAVGLGQLARKFGPVIEQSQQRLDGLLAVWQPALK